MSHPKPLVLRNRRPGRKARPRCRGPCRPRLEELEGRCVPAAITVFTVADAGPGSLRAAIQAADADPSPSTITFDPGLNGQTITLTSGALPAITAGGLTLQGPGANVFTIDGGGQGPVLSVAQGVGNVTISGLRITGGATGISNAGSLTVLACQLDHTANGPFDTHGIFNAGTMALANSVVAQNGSFNEGFPAVGGGVQNTGTMTVSGCSIIGNSNDSRVGAFGAGVANSGQMTITDSTVSNNVATALSGAVAGGGIFNSGTLTLLRSTVSGNQANPSVLARATGGGVATMGSSVTTITDCTITGNSSLTGGGGVQVLGGTLALTNCTVALNAGGGIALSGGAPAVGLQNTIVAQNTSGPDVSGAVQSGGDNLIGSPTGATGLLPGDRTNVDPLLGPLQFNGGPTQTLALLPGSPAIDAGSNAAPGLPATDQRGLNRVVNNVVDIGAFEYQPPGNTMTLTAAPNPGVRGRPVKFSVTVTGTAPGSNPPTGRALFQSGGTALGAAALSGGSATFTTAGLPVGDNLVTAVYSGDVNFTGGTTANASERVNLPPPATAGVFDPATATWYLRSSNSAGLPDAGQFQYGPAGSVPVTGTWAGAVGDPIGVFDPSSATWYLRNEDSAGPPDAGQFQYGGTGWLPVTGDWNNSGHTGVGAFDPATQT
ncbi:MAG TPA: choice-of-anchor Q domain-containing protein, partial [Gemmataceae bacterium]|nr:choice-of-anchor Q domain-containing protein [Gemmataceae bacterium]